MRIIDITAMRDAADYPPMPRAKIKRRETPRAQPERPKIPVAPRGGRRRKVLVQPVEPPASRAVTPAALEVLPPGRGAFGLNPGCTYILHNVMMDDVRVMVANQHAAGAVHIGHPRLQHLQPLAELGRRLLAGRAVRRRGQPQAEPQLFA